MRINLISLLVCILLFVGCTGNNDKKTPHAKQEQAESVEETNPIVVEPKAKFQMMIANTAGTSYVFSLPGGTEIQVFPDEKLEGMEFANGLKPGFTDHDYFDKAFEIKYQKRKFETTGGDLIDKYYLLEVKELQSQKTDFEVFWEEFQAIIAKNDKDAFMALCTPDMKSNMKNSFITYEGFVNDRMRKEVAKATAADIEKRGELERLFVFKVIHSPEDEITSNYYSLGFWFKKVDGKWMINDLQNAG